MPITTPPVGTDPPTLPTREAPVNFPARADAFLAWVASFYAYVVSALANVFNNATEAFNAAVAAAASAASALASAAAAASSATAAASSAGAALWVSGTYAGGAAARSPSTLRVYINRTAGSRTTDPALDPTNWAFPAGYLTVVPRTGTAHTVTANERSNFTNAGAVAVVLPTTLAAGDEWAGHFDNARLDNTFDLGTNSLKHNGVTRSGVVTINLLGPVNLVWGGDYWRFK
ncbi:hypothetical protein LNV23_18930 [Paucibacter sp. DJ1R-11]|uniref:hypothetical protein n=1 Tax=Paucibacter sp. DJ1R-11 TaxID=2893556 RepID=UPI0021E44526|nr:hypothetical protein [Paucibacter sp. DJ1R-11]MCV2365528.1 hypothetical protein [Paucibacter sp. DJ1R-11]